MLISRNYLNRRLMGFDEVSDDELEVLLNRCGIELETITNLEIPGLKLGRIISCEKIPETKLSETIVDIGSEKVTILCGAPNVAKGQLVCVATIGTQLTPDFLIAERKMFGRISQGMICGINEVGFKDKVCLDTDGIYVFPDLQFERHELGKDANKLLTIGDKMIEISLTANRNDIAGVEDIVKELSIHYPRYEVRGYEKELAVSEEVVFNDSDYIKGYGTSMIEINKNIISPENIKFELMKYGIKPTNTIQDVAILTTLLTGVTVNLYDAKSPLIVQERDAEVFTMCGTDTIRTGLEINQAVSTLLHVEFAIMDKHYARSVSRNHKIENTYVSKSLKGISTSIIESAFNMWTYLVKTTVCPCGTASELTIHKAVEQKPKQIKITPEYVSRIIGNTLDIDTIYSLLKKKYRVKFGDNDLTVIVPPHRFDLNNKIDIVEEVAILYGYENITPVAPKSLGTVKYPDPSTLLESKVTKMMTSYGFDEVRTYNLVSESDNTWNPYNYTKRVVVKNPISSERGQFKLSLLNPLVKAFVYNDARKLDKLKLFEVHQVNTHNGLNIHLAMIGSSSMFENAHQKQSVQVDFYSLKGILENMMSKLGLTGELEFKYPDANQEVLHPTKSANVYLNKEYIGYIGELHPSYKPTKKIKGTCVMEISLSTMDKVKKPDIKFAPISNFPIVKKDFSFMLSKDQLSGEIINKVKELEFVWNVEVFDIYESDAGRSIAFKTLLSSQQSTLSSEDISSIISKVEYIITTNGGELR